MQALPFTLGIMTQWRYLAEGENPAPWNMAVDEALLLCYPRFGQPTLRLYAWDKPTLSLGRFQPTDGINLIGCRDQGICVVRRPTGGRAVLHHREVTYSVVAGLELFPAGVAASYRHLSQILLDALERLGLHPHLQRKHARSDAAACFEVPAFAELTLDGKKVCGSAQTRTKGALLQHGSLPLWFPWKALSVALNLSPALVRRLQGQAAGLCDFAPLSAQQVRQALLAAFEACVGPLTAGALHPEERALAQELAQRKYAHLDVALSKELSHAAGR